MRLASLLGSSWSQTERRLPPARESTPLTRLIWLAAVSVTFRILLTTKATREKAGTSVGAAQKDTARESGAKLVSLKGVVWVGVGLFVFGLATLFYPPLRALIGSVTTSLAITGGGVALIVLASLIVGNELLILGASRRIGIFCQPHGKPQGPIQLGVLHSWHASLPCQRA